MKQHRRNFWSHCERHQVNDCSIVGKVKTLLAIVICVQMAFWLKLGLLWLFFNLVERQWKLMMLMMSGSPFALYRKHWSEETSSRTQPFERQKKGEKCKLHFYCTPKINGRIFPLFSRDVTLSCHSLIYELFQMFCTLSFSQLFSVGWKNQSLNKFLHCSAISWKSN